MPLEKKNREIQKKSITEKRTGKKELQDKILK
jgi:hypothetical protein